MMTHHSGHRAHIPLYTWVCIAAIAVSQSAVYFGTRLALPYLEPHMLSGPLDARIPFSAPWITVYLLSFPFWAITGLWVFSGEKSLAYRVTASYVLAMLFSGAVFLIWPLTMERPEVTGGGLFNDLVRWIYSIDTPTNLCPSLHVLLSWFCFRCAAESKLIPRWYKAFSFVFFVLVCCCVLLVKQHLLIDIPVGIAVAELSLQLGRFLRLERIGFAIEKVLIKP